jgi:hypothetical protein
METTKNKISGKDLLNEKGLQLLNEAMLQKKNTPDELLKAPIKKKPTGRCSNCDPDFGYVYINGKCFCI